MPTPAKPNGNGKNQSLQEKHAALIARYDVTAGAQKAAVSTAITDLEYEMTVQRIEFEPWEKPLAYVRKWEMSEQELLDRIARAREIRDDAGERDIIRARADKDVTRLEQQAERRTIEIPAKIEAAE